MSASLAVEHVFKVGKFTVVMSFPATVDKGSLILSMHAEWSPRMPGRPLTPTELDQYRTGRAEAVRLLTERTGLRIMVTDL